ncbi:MAG: ribose 5-phosphate isomerase B [Bacteroidota bacterium]
MKIGIAADHGGFELKQKMSALLQQAGHDITDFGAHQYDASDDYPDFVVPLAKAVAANTVDKGIAICGSGVGASIAANKIAGIRAALITEAYSAAQGVEHDAMNILCLGGRVIGEELAKVLVHAFVAAQYTGEERHNRRLSKVKELEGGRGRMEE